MKTAKELDLSPRAKVPIFEKTCFLIGGLGPGMIQIFVASYLMIYYTNVAGISAGIAGSVIAVSKLLDGVSDIVMGHILNNTNSRYGKARPWMLRMALPSAVCLFLAFAVPESLGNTGKIVYVFVTYNLLNTVCYTALGLANSALRGYITENQKERGFFGGMFMLLATFSTIVMASTILQICRAVGGGDSFTQKGWSAMILIYAVIVAVTTLIGFLFTNERVTIANRIREQENGQAEAEDGKKEVKGEKVSLLVSLKALLLNKYWVIFVVAMVMVTLNASFSSTALYYAQYVLGDELLYTPISNIKTIVSLVGIALGFVGMAKFKKRDCVVVGMLFIVVGLLIPMLGFENMTMISIGAGLAGIGTGLAGCVLPGMLTDTLTYGQWRFGFDMMGIGAAGYSFSSKLSGSLGTLLLGWTMTLTHFVEKAATQSATAIAGLKAMYTWIPGILITIALVCMLRYDLDSRYDKIVSDLEAGKHAAAGEK